MHCKGGRKKSISIWSVVLKSEEWLVLFQSYYNSRWCSIYHFSSACKSSATRAACWKFRGWLRILKKKTNRDWTLVCLLWRPKISEKTLYRFNKSPWWLSHLPNTQKVRGSSPRGDIFVMHCKGGRKKWISIWSVVSKSEDGLVLYQSNYNSPWCSSYHFSSAWKSSATRAAWWMFRSRLRIFMNENKTESGL